MLEGLKSMFGYGATRERPNPDPITAQITVASQRNERASRQARAVLREVLERNDDRLRGNK
jgi:hypothetical protein